MESCNQNSSKHFFFYTLISQTLKAAAKGNKTTAQRLYSLEIETTRMKGNEPFALCHSMSQIPNGFWRRGAFDSFKAKMMHKLTNIKIKI